MDQDVKDTSCDGLDWTHVTEKSPVSGCMDTAVHSKVQQRTDNILAK